MKNRNIKMSRKEKVKKYFENNLCPGDFVSFPTGQRYKILKRWRSYPVCLTKDCKKVAQGHDKLYLFCINCFKSLTVAEKEKYKIKKHEVQQQKKKEAAIEQAKKSMKKKLNLTKLKKIDFDLTEKSDSDTKPILCEFGNL